MEQTEFNAHNKNEFPPAHTTEHIINQAMIRLFGCERALEAHIERKKSKMDFAIQNEPSMQQIQALEDEVNKVIRQNLPVTFEFTTQQEAKSKYNLKRLPEKASENVRIVKIGDYDACLCIGSHVDNTSQIGTFKIVSSSFNEGVWRLRWKISEKTD